jgi:hypothetical protein
VPQPITLPRAPFQNFVVGPKFQQSSTMTLLHCVTSIFCGKYFVYCKSINSQKWYRARFFTHVIHRYLFFIHFTCICLLWMCFVVLATDYTVFGFLFSSKFLAQFLFHLVYYWACTDKSFLPLLVESMNVFLYDTSCHQFIPFVLLVIQKFSLTVIV